MQNLEFDNSRLRGRIIEKFGSNKNFSKMVKQSPTTVSRLINNKGMWTRDIIDEWRLVLDIAPEEIGYYFFYTSC